MTKPDRPILLGAMLCLLSAGPLAAAKPGAAAPAAHNPQFDDREVWPKLSGKEAFLDQKWAKGRVLVWRYPGKSGIRGGRGKALDCVDASNWLIDGEPGSGRLAMPDENTDLVLPASETRYAVYLSGRGWSSRMKLRHVTVGRNAQGACGTVYGNIWVKGGGKFGERHPSSLHLTGLADTFVRNDNRPSGRNDFGARSRVALAHYIGVTKYKGASVEFLGDNGSSDELVVHEGAVIVGPDSVLRSGYTSTSIVGPEGVLQFQSGARYARRRETWMGVDVMVQGVLRGGSPQRPLRKDAVLELTLARYKRSGEDDKRKIPYTHAYSLVIAEQGKARVHSEDPKNARLVFRSASERPIKLAFLGDARFDGVLFDRVKEGGIQLADPAARQRWEHVFYGEHNQAEGDELYAPFDPEAAGTVAGHTREKYQKRGTRVPGLRERE